jgi:hypothetical protein
MPDQRKTERDEPQRTSVDDERIRSIAEQDDDFDDYEELEDEDADENDTV